MNNQVSFDSLLRMAVRETYMDQVNAIPPEDELEKILHTDDNFKNKIKAIVQKENRNEKLIHFSRAAAKVAVVVLVCISLTFASLMTAEAVRESVATTILEWHDKFTRIFIETDTQPDKLPEIRFNYIPEGFELIEEESIKDESFMIYTFSGKKKDFLRIHINFRSSKIDNEYSSYYIISIENKKGIWINNGYTNQLIISSGSYCYNITSSLPIENVINVYKNIEIL